MKKKLRLCVFPSDPRLALKLILNTLIYEQCRLIIDYFAEPREAVWRRRIEDRLVRIMGRDVYHKSTLEPYFKLLRKAKLFDLTLYPYTKEDYELTEAGFRIGKPLVEFFRSWEKIYPLAEIFAYTKTITDQTYSRFRILEILYLSPNRSLRKYQLIYQKDTRSEPAFQHLSRMGLIDLESMEMEEPRHVFSAFKYTKKGIADILSDAPKKLQEITQLFYKAYPQSLSLKELVESLGYATMEVEKILTILKERGIVTGTKTHPVQREVTVSLTAQGKQFWEDFCLPLREFLRNPSQVKILTLQEKEVKEC